MAKNLVIGCVNNYVYEDIYPWFNSLRKSGYEDNVALVAYNMSKKTVDKLTKESIILLTFNKDDNGNMVYEETPNFNICVERFAHLWYFFFEVKDGIRDVVATDVKDVIFQRNPFANNPGTSLEASHFMVGTENLLYEDEPWGRNNMLLSFGSAIYETMRKKEIYCAGVIAGKRDVITDLFLNIFLLCRGSPSNVAGGGGPDQAALNVLLATFPYNMLATKLTAACNYICHAGTTLDAIKAGSGEIGHEYMKNPNLAALKQYEKKLLYMSPKFVDGKVCTYHGDPYFIVHQYDRVPEWKKSFLEQYGENR